MKQPPKTIDEAVDRLRAGERFKYGVFIVFYDGDAAKGQFRMDSESPDAGSEPLTIAWDYFYDWQPIPEWHESLSPENKRFCWVDDRDPEVREFAVWIKGKGGKGFYTHPEVSWTFATPVLPEDLEHG